MRYYTVLLLILLVCLFSSCNEESGEPPQPGKFSVGLSETRTGAPEAGRTTEDLENLTKVLVTIETSGGELIHDLTELTLVKLGTGFISEELPLMPGSYRVTRFLVADADNNVLYATPVEGSPLAELVEHPLPIDFTIASGQESNLVMEVVSVAEADQPSDYGYTAFSLLFPQSGIPLGISATIADEYFTGPVEFTLEAEGKNVAGEIVWTDSWDINDRGTVTTPSGYHSYTFRAVKAGQLPHVQHYLATDFPGNEELVFEMIPENSEDFIVREMYDGKVKLYFPADRTKIYTRIELAEDFRLESVWVDKDGASWTGVPLGQLAWTQMMRQWTISTCR